MLLAVIGGSEAHRLLADDFAGDEVGPCETPFGPSEPLRLVSGPDGPFLFLPRHGRSGYNTSAPNVNYRANIYALKDKGATHVIAWSGPGAVNPDFNTGSFVVPNDLIDETRTRKSTYFESGGLGFVRQNPVFCPVLTDALEQALSAEGVEFRMGGTYVVTQGPRLETPAEIRKFRSFGADLVGMTLAPEVFLARELEMHYAALCLVTNAAEGVRERAFEPGVLFEGLADPAEAGRVKEALSRFGSIIRKVQPLIESASAECSCEKLLDRYRGKKLIGADFREYVQ
jgi:5'-methylthioadenosine phosphorylase